MHRSHQVNFHHQAKISDLHFGETFVPQNARIVDQNIHPAPGLHGLLHHGFDGLKIGHRGPIDNGLPAILANLINHRLGGTDRATVSVHISAQIIDHHFSPPGRQRQCVLFAQTTPCTSDDGNAAFEIDSHDIEPLEKIGHDA